VRYILDDLSKLSPRRLERRLQGLAREALPCVATNVFDGNPSDGLTVGLWVESQGRRDVTDLARVLETEPGGHVATAWSLLTPNRRHRFWRLLLRVQFERPVSCEFAIGFDFALERSAEAPLPLLLAASGFAIGFDHLPHVNEGATWVPAPSARECVIEVLAAKN
jgi:hypothetical protein